MYIRLSEEQDYYSTEDGQLFPVVMKVYDRRKKLHYYLFEYNRGRCVGVGEDETIIYTNPCYDQEADWDNKYSWIIEHYAEEVKAFTNAEVSHNLLKKEMKLK